MKKDDPVVLKQVKIENGFGIKKLDLSFELKKMKSPEDEDQLIKTKEGNFCIAPTFLAKNASGKTSLIKAMDFAVKLANRESFIDNVVHYAQWVKGNVLKTNNSSFANSIHDFIEEMCDQVVFAGSEYIRIELAFTKNNLILVELTRSSFEIKINEKLIDVVKILEKLFEINLENMTSIESEKYFRRSIGQQIADYKFLSITSNSLYRDARHITTVKELLLKDDASKFLKMLVNYLGAKELKFLLRQLDPKISNFEYDPEDKSISIFMQETSEFPISSRSLSFGTIKTIEILAKSITLFKNGGLFLVDEIENGLHLSLIKLILAFYANPKINQKNAQIILTTHNPSVFKEDVISKFNAFLFDDNKFINIKNHKAINRTEDQKGFIAPKNYYNDYYWSLRGASDHTTISDFSINLVVNSLVEKRQNEGKPK